jgi:hypothetical protein
LFRLVRNGFLTTILIAVAACQSAVDTGAPSPSAIAAGAPATNSTSSPTSPAAEGDSSSPTLAPSTHLFPVDVGRRLEAGTYVVDAPFAEALAFALPAGFGLDGYREGMVAVSSSAGTVAAFIVDGVFEDPCDATGRQLDGPSAPDLVAELSRMRGFVASDAVESTIDGRKAWTFELSNSVDTSTADCARGPMLPLFTSRGNPDGEATNGGTHQRITVVAGSTKDHLAPSYEGPVLFVEDGWSSAANLATLDEIVASVDFAE